ncbi:MAG: SDR family NAD(P)-dependent oxidoreductase [Rhizobiales bacterium]|nr:SDR family NAD(P)-dependent oxidoreductase [Hyphomicrobiales bacterium]
MKLDSGISAVVTGAASGLGEATARRLAAAGVKVAVFDLDAERGKVVAGSFGGLFVRCDVADPASVDAALGQARAAHGQERILVNCAGIATAQKTVRRDRESGAPVAHDIAVFERTIRVNLVGTFVMLSRAAAGMSTLAPLGPDGTRGVIVNTASIAAEDGQIGQAAYAASKGGVAALTLPVARDLAREGIRVMAILPGLFHTPMVDGLPEEVRRNLARGVPFPSRLGRADEYAALVQHICENDMLNGETIRLDGALRMQPS